MKRDSRPDKPPKKPYRKPMLEKYGTIRSLTRATGTLGKNDTMSGSTTKTG